jgi:transposase
MPGRGLRQTLRGLPPFAPAYARSTRRLEAFVNDLRGLMTVSDLAAITGRSWDPVQPIVKSALEKGYGHPRLQALRSLAIDEIDLGREKKFYPLVPDLESGRLVWVAKGKGPEALRKCWRALRLSKARIAAVTRDMSAAYWAAVAENLPDAAGGFDRFHIVKLVNEKRAAGRRAMGREATGRMQKAVTGIRYRLLMNRHNGGPAPLPRLEAALKPNAPLNIGSLLKEALGLLWGQRSREARASFLKDWCPGARAPGIRPMQQLAKTLSLHARGILNWWEHRISNGRMEGINNKSKTRLRQTDGLRDERYFTLKLYRLHDSRLALLG